MEQHSDDTASSLHPASELHTKMKPGPKPRPAAERVLGMIEQVTETGCWIYMGFLNANGYGRHMVRSRFAEGKARATKAHITKLAHRIVYEATLGAVPAGLELDHICRVRCCVNPAHLRAITHAENVRRSLPRRSLVRTHCIRGHELIGWNRMVAKTGHISCRLCHNELQVKRNSRYRMEAKNRSAAPV